MQNREVVITGLGVVSPIGVGVDAFHTSIREGRSGVQRFSMADDVELPFQFGAELRGFDAKAFVKPRKAIKLMSRELQIGFAAAEIASEHAQIIDAGIEPDRFGVVYGSEMLYCDIHELANAYRICMKENTFIFDEWGAKAINEMYPLWMLRYLPNMTACHIGIRHDARGPNNSITSTEVSTLLAMMESAEVIRRGHADVMIAGGAGSRLPITAMLFRGDINVSGRNDSPETASRPFCSTRDGMVNGEGSAAFVLELREHAEARGATIYGTLRGWSSNFVLPGDDRTGLQTAIEHSLNGALRSAECSVADVGHVNAHGLSTRVEDVLEAKAIKSVLDDTPVTAPKSYFGNLGAGTGGVEAAASILMFAENRIPVTLNTQEVDADCPINVVTEDRLMVGTPRSAMLTNYATTGQAVSMLVTAE